MPEPLFHAAQEEESQLRPARGRGRRSLLALVFLYLSLLGWLRLELALSDASLLTSLGIRPGPAYLAAGGALWGVSGLAGAALMVVSTPWRSVGVRVIGLVFTLSYWADRLAFTRSAEMQVNWPFSLGMTLAGWLLLEWVARTALEGKGYDGKQRTRN